MNKTRFHLTDAQGMKIQLLTLLGPLNPLQGHSWVTIKDFLENQVQISYVDIQGLSQSVSNLLFWPHLYLYNMLEPNHTILSSPDGSCFCLGPSLFLKCFSSPLYSHLTT